MLTGRGVRIVLPDVCARRRVPNEGDGDGGGGGEKSVGMRYGHTDLCMANSPGVCFPSQPSASVSMCVPLHPLRCYRDMCDPSESDAFVLHLLQGGNVLEEIQKKKKIWTHVLFGDLHTCRPAVCVRCLQRPEPTRSHPRSPDTAA